MKKNLLIILSLLALPGLRAQEKIDILSVEKLKEDKVLATVGTRKITVKEFLYGYEFGPSFSKRGKRPKETYLNYLINEKLIASDASEKKLDTSYILKSNLQAVESDLATEEMYRDKIQSRVSLTKEEIDNGYDKKLTRVSIKWLYARNPDSLFSFAHAFKNGVSFDSLYYSQFNENVMQDERSMSTDLLKLKYKNPEIYKVIDTLKRGEHSGPVKGNDGWYIFRLSEKYKEVSLSTVPAAETINEVKTFLTQHKSDSISSVFIDSLMRKENPVLKGDAFLILRAYLGSYTLDKNIFLDWKLKEKADSIIAVNKLQPGELNDLTLVQLSGKEIKIKDFVNWFRLMNQYIKVEKNSYQGYSASVESLIWRMVRDNMLTKLAYQYGYQNRESVKAQVQWWRDKMLFAVERDEIVNSVMLKSSKDKPDEQDKLEVNKKLLSKINSLKKKFKVSIDRDLLKKITLDADLRAIETYAVKKGGIFPRPAFPSIDFLWESWQ